MTVAQLLASFGFVGSTVSRDAKGKTLVKVWTNKGWHYAKLPGKDFEKEVTDLSRQVTPGVWP